MTTFIHTADWHLGRPFHSIREDESRFRLRQARLDAVSRIGEVARAKGARFCVVAGDLFDCPTPPQETVAAALGAIGGLGVQVHVIPGNHDHGGPAGPWRTDHFIREQPRLAPNLVVHQEGVPCVVEGIVLLPAPLAARHELQDPTLWIRDASFGELPPDLPRVVLAHGSTMEFMGASDPDDFLAGTPNLIHLARLPLGEVDYVALGDWHGTQQVGDKAWYSGTPEPDRFPRGTDYASGQVLVVEVERGGSPQVEAAPTGSTFWRTKSLHVPGDERLADALQELEALAGTRTGRDLLRLTVTGRVGLASRSELDQRLADLEARFLQLDVDMKKLHLQPSEDELASLSERPGDPVVAQVAASFLAQLGGEQDRIAGLALQRLHAYVTEED